MAQLMLINPKKRAKRRAKSKSPARRRKYSVAKTNPVAPLRRRRRTSTLKAVSRRPRPRRNPIGMGGVMGMVTDAALGGAGAIAINYAFDKLPLPINFKMGIAGTASKAALAIAVGTFGKKFLGNTAGKLAAGSLIVTAYEAFKNFMPVSAPVIPQTAAGLGYYGAGVNAGVLGEYMQGDSNYNFATNSSNMGEYVQY